MASTIAKMSLAFLGALAAAFVTASLASTQSVLARVGDMGLPVSMGQRIAASLHDLAGMATLFLPLIAIALLIAFLVAGLLARRYPDARLGLYALAGACALWTLHSTLTLALDITPVAAARSAFGLTFQCAAGALGGAVFALLTPRSAPA